MTLGAVLKKDRRDILVKGNFFDRELALIVPDKTMLAAIPTAIAMPADIVLFILRILLLVQPPMLFDVATGRD